MEGKVFALVDGEEIICEGRSEFEDRMFFTNRRICILRPQQAKSLSEIRNPKYIFTSEYLLESVKDVYAETGNFIATTNMIIELTDGKKIKCKFSVKGAGILFDTMGTLALKQKSITDRWVDAVRRAIDERKRGSSYGLRSQLLQANKMYCRYCGNENPTDAVYCEKCGKKIT